MTALGGPSAAGIPLVPGGVPEEIRLSVTVATANSITIAWPEGQSGFILEASDSLSSPVWEEVPGQAANTATIQTDGPTRFFRLRK